MTEAFDHLAWQRAIAHPDWYIKLYPELKELLRQWRTDPDSPKTEAAKEEMLAFFEAALENEQIALGSSGQDLDAERKAIDTIVIHHSSNQPGYRLPRLNAVQLLRVYVPYFNHPTLAGEAGLRGQPMWSNHVQDGQPVFYAYHWLLRMDGSAERLLQDKQIGWHAGNWDINCRSIGICLDNDYENQDPTPEVLQQLSQFITKNYPAVALDRIFGHGEVSQNPTICPGTFFESRWKQRLLELLA